MNWKFNEVKTKPELVKEFGQLTAQLLANRGIDDLQAAYDFFAPKYDDLQDFTKLPNAHSAAKFILDAVGKKEKVFIYGDYDVDGVTATSILFDFLYRELGADVLPYIPSRFDEGYGLNEQAIKHIIAHGGKLIVTVDCGIRDRELIAKYCDQIDFIVTDHHSIGLTEKNELDLPLAAKYIVHPALPECPYELKEICAAAVSFKLIQNLAAQKGIDLQELKPYLAFVALATICDVMPLLQENRIFVHYGLQELRNTSNPGLKALIQITGIEQDQIDAYHLGFVLGPRLNAGGRIDHALVAVKLLTTRNNHTAWDLATKLNELNSERQQATFEALQEAENLISAELEHNIIVVSAPNWSEGIVGLVASRLCEKYHKPVLVASDNAGILKGSARSISSFHITNALARTQKLLTRFGGHKQAAGFTLQAEHYQEFKTTLLEIASAEIAESDLIAELPIEAEISEADLSLDTAKTISAFAPFGFANPNPNLLIKHMNIVNKKAIGQDGKHLKLTLKKGQTIIFALAFNQAERFASLRIGDIIDCVGSLEINSWQGKQELQLKLKDIKDAHEQSN